MNNAKISLARIPTCRLWGHPSLICWLHKPTAKGKTWYSPLGWSQHPEPNPRSGLDRNTLLCLLTWSLLCTATGAAQAINTQPNECSLPRKETGTWISLFQVEARMADTVWVIPAFTPTLCHSVRGWQSLPTQAALLLPGNSTQVSQNTVKTTFL